MLLQVDRKYSQPQIVLHPFGLWVTYNSLWAFGEQQEKRGLESQPHSLFCSNAYCIQLHRATWLSAFTLSIFLKNHMMQSFAASKICSQVYKNKACFTPYWKKYSKRNSKLKVDDRLSRMSFNCHDFFQKDFFVYFVCRVLKKRCLCLLIVNIHYLSSVYFHTYKHSTN